VGERVGGAFGRHDVIGEGGCGGSTGGVSGGGW